MCDDDFLDSAACHWWLRSILVRFHAGFGLYLDMMCVFLDSGCVTETGAVLSFILFFFSISFSAARDAFTCLFEGFYSLLCLQLNGLLIKNTMEWFLSAYCKESGHVICIMIIYIIYIL